MLDLDATKINHLKTLLNEFSLQISEVIGCEVNLKITEVINKPERDYVAEDSFMMYVIDKVCYAYGISEIRIKSTSRIMPLPDARGIAYKIIKTHQPQITFKKIGMSFGGRHYSTVMARMATLEKLMETEPELKKKYEIINQSI